MPDSSATLVISVRPDTPQAHRRRVAAWCAELARGRGIAPEQESVLEEAARSHHRLLAVLDGPRQAEFLHDIGVAMTAPERPAARPDMEILELAEALEDHFAWEPFSGAAAGIEPWAEKALDTLFSVQRATVERTIADLPVLPTAAQRALGLFARDDWNARDLQSIATSDPVLAAELIRAANSAAFAARNCARVPDFGGCFFEAPVRGEKVARRLES